MLSEAAPLPRVAIAAILKNEGPYILEWVAFHRMIGVTRFFIADNDSTDGSTQLLAALHAAGLVTHIPFPQVPNRASQLAAYQEIVRRHRRDADWIAFVDGDEFLMPVKPKARLPRFFSNVAPDVGAMCVNWACYGSSHRREPSLGPVIERFTKRAKDGFGPNLHYKTVVRTAALSKIGRNPHYVEIARGYRYAHTDGSPLVHHHKHGLGLSDELHWKPLRINHYVVKSRAEFDHKKAPRGRATIPGALREAGFFRGHDRNDVEDPVDPSLVARTKREMRRIRRLLLDQGCASWIIGLDQTIGTLVPLEDAALDASVELRQGKDHG